MLKKPENLDRKKIFYESVMSLTLVPPNYTVPYEQIANLLCGFIEKNSKLWVKIFLIIYREFNLLFDKAKFIHPKLKNLTWKTQLLVLRHFANIFHYANLAEPKWKISFIVKIYVVNYSNLNRFRTPTAWELSSFFFFASWW